MSISRETLMAYVDGELDERTRMEVEAAMTLDAEIMHEIERQQMLRGQLRDAFDDVLKEPVPERLLTAVRTAPGAERKATVVDLAQARKPALEKSARRWSALQWGAMAATLVIGVFVGKQMSTPETASFASRNGQLTARGALAQALTSRLSGETADTDRINIALSFRNEAGNYCRAFVIQDANAMSGLACREGKDWQLQILASAPVKTETENYRMAASDLPASVLQAAQSSIAGEPLAAADEVAAREAGWR
jgi:hypothetical protein